jgi:hypothetical protein
MTPENKYTAYVAAEECNEVSQGILKILRFGIDCAHPETGVTNKRAIEEEIGQLKYCLDRFIREQQLNGFHIQEAYDKKMITWNKWMEYYNATVA